MKVYEPMPLCESRSHAPATTSCDLGLYKIVLPLPTAASAKHVGEPPSYDLGFRVCAAYEGVRVYAIVCIAFAFAGHDLAGSCERGPYKIVLPLPTATSAKHWGEPHPYV